MTRDPASFRDPSGYVFDDGERILRTVNPRAAHAFRQLDESGVFDSLAERGLLIETGRLEPGTADIEALNGPRGETPELVLRHPRIPFVSYPYEWTFSELQEAAIAHLELQVAALDLGASLSDSTPYNMQYMDGRFMHIDVLSLKPYQDGEIWTGYNQFCKQFLAPLLLEAWCGTPFQPWLRGSLEGIPLMNLAGVLPHWRRWLDIRGLMHITLQARMERRASSTLRVDPRANSLSRERYRVLLSEMQHWISDLRPARREASYWREYADDNSYTERMRQVKLGFITDFVRREGVRALWDIGGNTGDFSVAALDAGAGHAVVLDTDLDSLERAWKRTKSGYPGMLPLVIDIADPSPALGWNHEERRSLAARCNADAVLALAIVHHLVIGRNIPLDAVTGWITGLAPRGVIEFVPKSDPMVRRMLISREDVFDDYDEDSFRTALGAHARITGESRLAEDGRLVVSYARE